MRQRGYSLIELIVVLVIVGLMMALVATSITSRIGAAEIRAVRQDLVAALRYTRGQAIFKRQEKVLSVNVDNKTWQAPDREAFSLPEDMDISLLTARSELTSDGGGGIRFFPDGASTGGRITLTHEGREWKVNVAWLTGEVTLEEQET